MTWCYVCEEKEGVELVIINGEKFWLCEDCNEYTKGVEV